MKHKSACSITFMQYLRCYIKMKLDTRRYAEELNMLR